MEYFTNEVYVWVCLCVFYIVIYICVYVCAEYIIINRLLFVGKFISVCAIVWAGRSIQIIYIIIRVDYG